MYVVGMLSEPYLATTADRSAGMYTSVRFLSLSFLLKRLPSSIASSMLIATNVILVFHSGCSLSQAGSSLAHGLHHSAPTVTSTHLPLNARSLNGLPLSSTAMSSSANRSPTLSDS